MNFKTGDKVRVVNGTLGLEQGAEGIVRRSGNGYTSLKPTKGISAGEWYTSRFELVEAAVRGPLKPQLQAILNALSSGPKTASQVATAIGVSFARNVQGRIRDLRTEKYGSHKITARKVDGSFIYALEA